MSTGTFIRTIKVGRIGTGTAWHRVAGHATSCNHSGRPQRIHSVKELTLDLADLTSTDHALCGRCFS